MARWKWIILVTPLGVLGAVVNFTDGDTFNGALYTFTAACFALAGIIEWRKRDQKPQ